MRIVPIPSAPPSPLLRLNHVLLAICNGAKSDMDIRSCKKLTIPSADSPRTKRLNSRAIIPGGAWARSTGSPFFLSRTVRLKRPSFLGAAMRFEDRVEVDSSFVSFSRGSRSLVSRMGGRSSETSTSAKVATAIRIMSERTLGIEV